MLLYYPKNDYFQYFQSYIGFGCLKEKYHLDLSFRHPKHIINRELIKKFINTPYFQDPMQGCQISK